MYSANSCDEANAADATKRTLAVTDVEGISDGQYTRKTTDILLSELPYNRQALKLCYRFGNGPFVMFPQFAIYAKQLLSITLLSSDDTDLVIGAKATFLFSGVGVADGDRVRWVSSDAIVDADCYTLATTTEAVVEEAQAVFSFSNNIDRARICYKFGLDDYRLYKDVPIVKQGIEIVRISLTNVQILR